MKNRVLSLDVASRKLRHYSHGREFQVMINQPLKCILHKLDMTASLSAWTIEFSQFSMEYTPYDESASIF